MQVQELIDPQPWPELQEMLPKHSQSELLALKISIRDHGVLENGVYWLDQEGNLWIVDGVHRKEFSNNKMKWSFCNITPEDKEEALALGISLSTVHRNLSSIQLKELQDYLRARKTIQRKTALQLLNQGKTQEEAGALVGVSQERVSQWKNNVNNINIYNVDIPEPADNRITVPKSEYESIYIRSLKGETHDQIAADYKVARTTITTIISKERSRLAASTQNNNKKDEDPELTLFEEINYSPIPWDVWNFKKDKQYGLDHDGSIPAGIIFNLLYFYTNPSDLIIDPMAGGGVVGDVCLATNRKCKMYDIAPTRPEIKKHDLTEGWPENAENADLVFLDPPYFKKLEKEYGPNSISALDREDYLDFFSKTAHAIYDSGAKRTALLMSDYTDDEDPSKHIFIWHYVARFVSEGWIPERHIMAPIPTTAVHPDFVVKFRKSRKLARLGRSLVVFRRGNNG